MFHPEDVQTKRQGSTGFIHIKSAAPSSLAPQKHSMLLKLSIALQHVHVLEIYSNNLTAPKTLVGLEIIVVGLNTIHALVHKNNNSQTNQMECHFGLVTTYSNGGNSGPAPPLFQLY